MIYNSLSEEIEIPKIIKLTSNLYVMNFELMKIIPAKYIIKNAIENYLINPDTIIVESSSGTFAYGLAIVCAEKNLRFRIYSDPAISPEFKKQIEILGGEVIIIGTDQKDKNIQKKRLEALKDFCSKNKNTFWTNQYHSPLNRKSYHNIAKQIHQALGNDITIV